MKPLPTTKTPITTSVGASIIDTTRKSHQEVFVLEDLVQYHEALRHPSRTSTSIGMALAALQAIRLREQGMRQSFEHRIGERDKYIESLMASLELELGIATVIDGKEDAKRREYLENLVGVDYAGTESSHSRNN